MRDLLKIVISAYKNSREHRVSHAAAGLAYYMLFSLGPLFIIIISSLAFFFDESVLWGNLTSYVSGVVGPQAGAVLLNLSKTPITGADYLTGIISIVLVIWGASRLMTHLSRSFMIVHDQPVEIGIKKAFFEKIKAVVVLGIVTLIVLLVLLVGILVPIMLKLLNQIFPIPDLAVLASQHILLLFLLSLVLASIYKILSKKGIGWKESLFGGFAASFLFMIINAVFGTYISFTNIEGLYGAFSSVLFFLLWLYWSSSALLYGIEVTSVVHKDMI